MCHGRRRYHVRLQLESGNKLKRKRKHMREKSWKKNNDKNRLKNCYSCMAVTNNKYAGMNRGARETDVTTENPDQLTV
jgi:nitrate/TMAO reductase-like tetraheme cytochrome c subunit